MKQRRSQNGQRGPGSPLAKLLAPPGKIRLLRKIHTSIKFMRYVFIILLLIVAERVFLDGVHLPILFYTFFSEFCIQYSSIYFTNI